MFYNPAFFDIFGIGIFIFIIAITSWAIKTRNPPPRWGLIALFLIGIIGLIVDSINVWTAYIRF